MIAQLAELAARMLEKPVANFVARYSFAIGATGLVSWIRSLLHPSLGVECPFSLFYLSVLLTAWVAGTGPAIVSILLGALAAVHFFVQPESSLLIQDFADRIHLAIYVFVNFVATILFYHVQKQRGIAERRSIENQMLNDSLKLADSRKDEFLALLAHELRNPLAPIRTCVSLLSKESVSPTHVENVRSIIKRQVNHLVRLTDDLLDLSRFNQGKMELQNQNFDLRAAVEDAIEMTREMFQVKRQRLKVLLPPKCVEFYGDRVRLAQLVANLLGNASKYTPQEGRICVALEPNDDTILLTVDDNGIGFPIEERERILEPFVQMDTSRTRDYGGLGVGLTIVKRLVSLHQGKLNAYSQGPGRGSQFTVTLPQQRLVTSLGCQIQNRINLADSVTLPIDDSAEMKILIVDDNRDAADLLREMFTNEEIKVEVAYDGFEAIERFTEFAPTIMLVDIGLPGMDGYQVIQKTRRLESTHTLMIALTGWGGDSDIQKSKAAGFDLHLVKPIRFEEIMQILRPASVGRAKETRAKETSAKETMSFS